MSNTRTRAWRRSQCLKHISRRKGRISNQCFPPDDELISGKLGKTKGLPRYGRSVRERLPKRWAQLYFRSNKLCRAKQLGSIYPRKPWYDWYVENVVTLMPQLFKPAHMLYGINVLFVCSRNQWRSPTAEKVWNKRPDLSCRSAGTSPRARRTVSAQDVRWADVVYVMEHKHKNRLLARFNKLLRNKPLHVLDIPDQYQYMDPELVEMLEQELQVFLTD